MIAGTETMTTDTDTMVSIAGRGHGSMALGLVEKDVYSYNYLVSPRRTIRMDAH